MTPSYSLHPDRLFPSDPGTRAIARRLHQAVDSLPIVSPHGHTDPRWFAENQTFANPAQLFITSDHYLLRMLYSQGVRLEDLGVSAQTGTSAPVSPQEVWRLFAKHYYLFRGTPSRYWVDHALVEVLDIRTRLTLENADEIYEAIQEKLQSPEFLPRALYERFSIEVLATTDDALDDLKYHQQIRESEWLGRVIPTFRPDRLLDPEFSNFTESLTRLGELTGEDTYRWQGYLEALRKRREFFQKLGATATDHGPLSAFTANLSLTECETLLSAALRGSLSAEQAECFRGQMLTEMAKMSVDDGLVMQIHPGSYRNHNAGVYQTFGWDKGADIPLKMEFTRALKPLLDLVGNDPRLRIILFTLDETTYSRELAPLAGHYPCLRLGPPWWFHDSVEGMKRYKTQVIETTGFYNTAGFNDDTRAFLSLRARHDMARRIDCSILAEMVADHRLPEEEALEIAIDLSGPLARRVYRF